ncbi:MAG TPA: hypothetical protein ENI23_02455 [bacterium]|nr:hypothetical protein [bacterium]
MNNLSERLLQIKEKILKFRSEYENNETAVREQVINPILRILDWDPENPEQVKHNVVTDEGIPDYSLIKEGKIILFLEAKKLGLVINDKEIRQLAKYSFNGGTKYGVLTNGSNWVLIKSFEEGTSLQERIVWKVDLLNEDLLSVVKKLKAISRSNIEHIEILVKKVQTLDEIWKSLVDAPDEIVKGLIPVIKSIIAQGYSSYQFDDNEIEELLREKINGILAPPSQEMPAETDNISLVQNERGHVQKMKISGEAFELRNSYEILVNTANWLIRKGKLKPSDCPLPIGNKRNIVNKEPKHRFGDGFRAPKKLSNGLWIETSYSTIGCIDAAKRLLAKFDYSPDTLTIQ